MAKLTADEIWDRAITNLKQKQQVAELIAERLKKGDVVGVGSGSTSFMCLKALANRRDKEGLSFTAVPTSIEMTLVCEALNIPIAALAQAKPDWSFDGADEVDSDGNMIKGRGGAMLREKQLIKACPEVYIAVDKSKLVKQLGQNFAVPVEVQPEAINKVMDLISRLSHVKNVVLRQAVAKDGPVITENGNVILDVKFDGIVAGTETKLKQINGVIETGLFEGYKTRLMVSK